MPTPRARPTASEIVVRPELTRVRYELATQEQGFVLSRDSRAAQRTLARILETQKAQGHRVRRRRREDGQDEYLVEERTREFIARYWVEGNFGG